MNTLIISRETAQRTGNQGFAGLEYYIFNGVVTAEVERGGGLSDLLQGLKGQHGVHGPGTESFEIESNEFKSERFEDARELGGHFWGHCLGQFVTCDLYPDDVTVVADPVLKVSEAAKRRFTLFDLVERFARDGTTVLDA